jgi:vacuolar-type H+-ATPase subunit H
MVDEITVHINVDDSEVEEADQKVEDLKEKAEKITEEVEEKASYSYNKVMLMARGAYMATAGLIRATGGTVSAIFRMAVSAAISAVAVFRPIIAAEAVTPGMQVQAAIGSANLLLAMMAIASATKKRSEVSHQILAISTALHGVSMMLSSYSL